MSFITSYKLLNAIIQQDCFKDEVSCPTLVISVQGLSRSKKKIEGSLPFFRDNRLHVSTIIRRTSCNNVSQIFPSKLKLYCPWKSAGTPVFVLRNPITTEYEMCEMQEETLSFKLALKYGFKLQQMPAHACIDNKSISTLRRSAIHVQLVSGNLNQLKLQFFCYLHKWCHKLKK